MKMQDKDSTTKINRIVYNKREPCKIRNQVNNHIYNKHPINKEYDLGYSLSKKVHIMKTLKSNGRH